MEKAEKNKNTAGKATEKIKLWGIVQGVGFRPFVAKCADKYGMSGEVLNVGGLVDITVTDTKERIDFFVERLLAEKPAPAEIVHIRRTPAEYREFDRFTILDSDEGDDEAAMIPADLSICPDCLRELYDEGDPRRLHPFISCMVCGPRYTVIDRIPYDRHNTAMVDWPMCDFCNNEYTDRRDRRYHAQTISCHDCGPVLLYRENPASGAEAVTKTAAEGDGKIAAQVTETAAEGDGKIAAQVTEPISAACAVLAGGGVIAMKGVGGYNLVADPLNPKAVAALRSIKHREQKPFAVMFKDMETVRLFSRVSGVEEKLLASSARPIILLEHYNREEIISKLRGEERFSLKERAAEDSCLDEIERSRFIGSFLPSMGAQHLLLDNFGLLIVTSANLSDMPIIKEENEIFELMDGEPLIAGCLYNERDIRVRVDDSVVRVIDGQPQMIRRSKGYAPVPLYVNLDKAYLQRAACAADCAVGGEDGAADRDNGVDGESGGADHGWDRQPQKDEMLLACGGQLKNSFALCKGSFAYVSQYFGDLDTVENRRIYAENVQRMKELFRIAPSLVVCDLHPLYASTEFAHDSGLPVLQVQHHHAHVASVMAEHHLTGKVVGVSMDGTGYGADGAIWGGEFMLCEGASMRRLAHLKYVKLIGGDSSMKDAAKSALSYQWAWEHGYTDDADGENIAVDLSDIMEYAAAHGFPRGSDPKLVRSALENDINVFQSSSMGRLFDAVSALLGIKEYNDYEGQCAIMLEDAAARALSAESAESGNAVTVSEADRLALAFHRRIAGMICDTCVRISDMLAAENPGEPKPKAALTGGVFQNKILMEESLRLLREKGFDVYYNVSVSPNDGGIALGQSYIGMYHAKIAKIQQNSTK